MYSMNLEKKLNRLILEFLDRTKNNEDEEDE